MVNIKRARRAGQVVALALGCAAASCKCVGEVDSGRFDGGTRTAESGGGRAYTVESMIEVWKLALGTGSDADMRTNAALDGGRAPHASTAAALKEKIYAAYATVAGLGLDANVQAAPGRARARPGRAIDVSLDGAWFTKGLDAPGCWAPAIDCESKLLLDYVATTVERKRGGMVVHKGDHLWSAKKMEPKLAANILGGARPSLLGEHMRAIAMDPDSSSRREARWFRPGLLARGGPGHWCGNWLKTLNKLVRSLKAHAGLAARLKRWLMSCIKTAEAECKSRLTSAPPPSSVLFF